MKRIFVFVAIAVIISFDLVGQDEDPPTSEDILVNYYNIDFEPYRNGVWYVAMTMSLSDQDLQNTTLGLFDDVINGNNSNWTLDLTAGRYISDFFLVGLTLGYEQSKFDGTLNGSFNIPFDRTNESELFTIGSFIRTSIPLTKNNRLSFYNDLGIGFSFGESELSEESNGSTQTSEADLFKFGLGINPGITYFAVNNVAFEAGVNLIGYQYTSETGTGFDGEESKRDSHEVNFSVNLLTISLGISYFFNTKTN